MPDKPHELPRPAHSVTIDLMGKKYVLDVSIRPVPDLPAIVEVMPGDAPTLILHQKDLPDDPWVQVVGEHCERTAAGYRAGGLEPGLVKVRYPEPELEELRVVSGFDRVGPPVERIGREGVEELKQPLRPVLDTRIES